MQNSNKIMVSVLVFSYNEEKYIRQAIDSILMQKTSFEFEVIIHDDASTDKSADIIREYERKHPDIIRGIYQEENKYQKGIFIPGEYVYPITRGKYIAYCDGDDYWTDEHKLQKQVDFLETHQEYVLCTHGFSFLYEKTQKKRDDHPYNCNRDIDTVNFIKWDGMRVPQFGTWVYRKEFAANRPEPFKVIQVGNIMSISDQPLGLYLGLNGKVWYMDEIMSVWRRYPTSVSTMMVYKNGIAFCESKITFLERAKEVFDNRYAADFEEEIEKQRMNIQLYRKNYRTATKMPAFRTASLSTKLKICIGCISPKLVDSLRSRFRK